MLCKAEAKSQQDAKALKAIIEMLRPIIDSSLSGQLKLSIR